MAPETAPRPAPQEIALPLEDVALFADGTGNIPDEMATRLQALIVCDDLKQIERTWRRIGSDLGDLRQMAEDAGVELLADGLYVFRALSRLRKETWESPGDVLDQRLDVPYPELIAMAGAMADRAEGSEKAEIRHLGERLITAFSEHLGGQIIVEQLMDQLLSVGSEAAEAALGKMVAMYRHRRKETAAGS